MENKIRRITLDTNPEDCNQNCIMCEEHSPYSDFIDNLYRETGIRKRRMPFEWVESIFKEASESGVKEIIPSTMGEPLLYKDFERIYDLAKYYQIKINLTTNGTFPLKTVEEWAKKIIPQTSDIKISWYGSTKETAKIVSPGVDLYKSLQNVKKLVKYRNEYFNNTGYYCRVTFQVTFMKINMHELSDIIKLAAELGVDRVKGHHLWTHFDEIKSLSFKNDKEGIQLWNQYVKQAEDTAEKYLKPDNSKVILENIIPLMENEKSHMPENYECPFLNKEIWVSATGKISPCCAPDNLRDSLGDFGNIQNQTLEQAIHSENYQDLLKNYKTKEICKKCNMRRLKVS